MTGFEPAAPASRKRCATKLRYIPYDLRHMLAQLGVYLDEFWWLTLVVFSNPPKKWCESSAVFLKYVDDQG